ncbi:hypothetical protein H4S14_002457 [Agrobacterium vitis]|nr:hypothetical protein [Agrobacterium vitis]MBE1438701.1 hypothetical protein [Agrobacterium vitis]
MSRKSSSIDLTARLRQVRDPIIKVECRTCASHGALDPAALVKKHGASITFRRLRRIAAMGCNWMVSEERAFHVLRGSVSHEDGHTA